MMLSLQLIGSYLISTRRFDWFFFIRRQLKRSGAEVMRIKGKAGGPDLRVGEKVFHLRDAQTSDLDVFFQIFSAQEYAGLCDFLEMYFGSEAEVFFIDGGANVGLATAYCSSRIPGLVAVGIEPFEGNHRLAGWNATYEKLILGALGANAGDKVKLDYADHPRRQWGIRTAIDPLGEVTVITLKDIISSYRDRKFDARVLKLDIEGAEFEVIHQSPDEVLRWFDVIVVEMHGTPADNRALVHRLLALGFRGMPMGEYWTFTQQIQKQDRGI